MARSRARVLSRSNFPSIITICAEQRRTVRHTSESCPSSARARALDSHARLKPIECNSNGMARRSAGLTRAKVLFFPRDLCEAAAPATRLFPRWKLRDYGRGTDPPSAEGTEIVCCSLSN